MLRALQTFLRKISALVLANFVATLLQVMALSAAQAIEFNSADFTYSGNAINCGTTSGCSATPTGYNSLVSAGSSTTAAGTVQLTAASGNQGGYVWNKNRIDLSKDFTIDAELYLGSSNGGADGLAFVLQSVSAASGSTGGGLGYAGIGQPCIGVEFDTYQNTGDLVNDHAAINKCDDITNHTVYAAGGAVDLADIEDGYWRKVKFTWTAPAVISNAGTLSVDFDKNHDGTYSSERIFNSVSINLYNLFNPSGNLTQAYWGFTAATGGANNLQAVRGISYTAVSRTNTAPTVATAPTNDTTNTTAGTYTKTFVLADDATTQGQWTFSTTSSNQARVSSVSTVATSATTMTVTYTLIGSSGSTIISITAYDADGVGVTTSFVVSPIAQATLTLTSTSATFLTNLKLLTSGGSGAGAVTYSISSTGTAGCSISNIESLTATSPGTCIVVAQKAAAGEYLAAYDTKTVTVSKASLTFTASASASLKYGSTTSTSYSTNLSLGVGSVPNLTGTLTYETSASTACNINSSTGLITMIKASGTCNVRVSLVNDTNFSDTSSALISIAPAKADTLTVTASAVNMNYNANSQAIPYDYTISGLKFSDTVTALSYGYSGTSNAGNTTSGTSSITAAGTYTITPSAASIVNSDSYTAVSYATGTLTVNRATRTISGSAAATVKYGSQETLTVTTVPSSNSDGAQSFSAGVSTACSVVSGTGVLTMNRASGTCSIVPSIAQGANYLTATGSAVSITPAKADAISVVAEDKSATYTGSAAAITPTYSVAGLQFSDTITVSYNYSGTANGGTNYTLSATIPTNAGSYSIVPSITFANSDSYTAPSSITNGTLTISRATRTLSPTTFSKTTLKYGETATVVANTTSPSSNSDGTPSYLVGSGCSINSSTGVITAGTYLGSCLETTTVSQGNNYESATASAVTFTLSKADTLTVTTATPSALTYTGSTAAVTPTISVSGLVAGNTATGATFNYSRAPNCASGGTCQVGDTGPGGGKVFYVSGSAINAVSGISSGGIYLEMAPATFSKTTYNWCEGPGNPYTTLFGATATTIGSGAANTKIMIDHCTGGAGVEAVNLTLGGKSDWFLPSYGELVQIYNQRNMLGLGSGQAAAGYLYWSSTEADTWIASSLVPWAGVGGQNKGMATPYLPIRAFSAAVSSYGPSGTAPTNAGSYVITPSSLTLAGGITTDYYVATVYETATLTINKATQVAFTNYSSLSGVFGTGFNIYKFGGSGDGEETLTVTDGTATGCLLAGTVLTSTTAGTCLITASKATSENYLQSDSTFSVYMYYYVPEPAAPVSTTPTQIAIATTNAWSVNATVGPIITGITPSSGPVGTVVTFTGTGFDGVNVIKIGRKDLTSVTGVNSTTVTGVIPAGAATGPIYIANSAGSDFNAGGFTVTP